MRAILIRPLRLIAGYGAIASALPYLALKLVWLGGGTLGVADQAMMRETSMVVLNSITAGMDVVGIALALAFTHRWGFRVPVWLLLPPIWVATGLLARFIVFVPITLIARALAPASLPAVAGGPVQPWVYVVVYIEFAGMGAGLIVAFVLYARARWTSTLDSTTDAVLRGVTRDLQVLLANATALTASALVVLHVAHMFGARTILGAFLDGIDAVLTMAAVAGIVMMVHRVGGRAPFWLPVAMTWLGAGSMFGWGLWQTINVVGQTALLRGAEGTAFVNLIGLLRMIVGLVMGLLFVFVLAERHATVSSPRSSPWPG